MPYPNDIETPSRVSTTRDISLLDPEALRPVLNSKHFSLYGWGEEPITIVGEGLITKLTFAIPDTILSDAPWDKICQTELAVSLATSLAFTNADGESSAGTIKNILAGGARCPEDINTAITNLVKQTLMAVSGHQSEDSSVNSIVKRCRDEEWKFQADWQNGRQLTVAIWKKDWPIVQATILFTGTSKPGDPAKSIPGVPTTPEGLNSLCSDYKLGDPGGK